MIDIFEVIAKASDSWFSETVAEVNDSPVAVRVMNDTVAKFHTHNDSDEMFLVLSGNVSIDTDTETVTLSKGQFYTVPAGIKHRARVEGRVELIVIGGKNA